MRGHHRLANQRSQPAQATSAGNQRTSAVGSHNGADTRRLGPEHRAHRAHWAPRARSTGGTTVAGMIPELRSVGFCAERWQDALESAYAAGALSVIGEVRDGQLLCAQDDSGAQLVVLTAEPYGSYAGFSQGAPAVAHISMADDVIGVLDLVEDSPELQRAGQRAPVVASLNATVAQGALVAEGPALSYQPIALAALAAGVQVTSLHHGEQAGAPTGGSGTGGEDAGDAVISHGLRDLNNARVAHHSGASVRVTGRNLQRRVNSITGDVFYTLDVQRPFPFVLAVDEHTIGHTVSAAPAAAPASAASTPAPDSAQGAARGDDAGVLYRIVGDVQFTAQLLGPATCSSSGGCGSAACGCGS